MPEDPEEFESPSWHSKTWVRIIALLLIPLIVGGLYAITSQLAIEQPTTDSAPQN